MVVAADSSTRQREGSNNAVVPEAAQLGMRSTKCGRAVMGFFDHVAISGFLMMLTPNSCPL